MTQKQAKFSPVFTPNSHMGFVSVTAVNQYLEQAKAEQLDVERALGIADIPLPLLSDAANKVTGCQFELLIEDLLNQSKNELFGLHCSRFIRSNLYSVLGLIGMNCATMKEAIDNVPIFEPLVGDMGVTELIYHAEGLLMIWHCQFPQENVQQHVSENVLASWRQFSGYLLGDQHAPKQVYLKRQKPADPEECSEIDNILGCAVKYGCDVNAVELSKQQLDLAILQPDPNLLQTLKSHAKELMVSTRYSNSMAGQIESLIRIKLGLGQCHQSDIAAQLGMSSKTLQRKLKEEGISFQQLVDSTRHQLALNLLTKTEGTVAEIGMKLGYSDRSTFFRNFKKWQSMTPGEFRANHQAKEHLLR